jgi:hypothetical protein
LRDESEPERGSMLSGATRSLWQCPVLLIALRAMSTLTRGSSLKRNSYSGFVDVTERAVRQVHGLSQFAGEVR